MRRVLIFILIYAQVAFATTRYVSLSGSHTAPFDTQGGAATNIQAAVDVSINGDMVIIRDGEYLLNAAVRITKAITLQSENGSDLTIINGGGSVPCFDVGNVAAVLSGLTITNGYNSNDGGGITCADQTPVITNCVIAGNEADYGGGILNGTVHHSWIRGNIALTQGGGANGSVLYDCLIVNNTAVSEWGGGAEGSTLYNCTVTANSAYDGGGVDTCQVYNSIVYSNTATVANPDSAYTVLQASCTSPGDELTGTFILENPLFVDFEGQNYRLQTGSPCINAGNDIYVSALTDLDGHPRVFGGTVDMGTYEMQASPTDTDGDQMDDAWEVAYFGHITNAFPNTNPGDDDSFSNLEEFIAGTDPTNPASFFSVTGWSSGSFVIGWPSVAGRQYRILWTESLSNSFTTLGPPITYPQNSYTDTIHSVEHSGFYKVQVELQ